MECLLGDSARLLRFDVSQHDGHDLAEFFGQYGFNFGVEHWRHFHRTSTLKDGDLRQFHINNIRDAALYLERDERDIENAIALLETALRLRPAGPSCSSACANGETSNLQTHRGSIKRRTELNGAKPSRLAPYSETLFSATQARSRSSNAAHCRVSTT